MADKHHQKAAADGSAKIHVTNLKKNFGKLEVLKDISLDVSEGEVPKPKLLRTVARKAAHLIFGIPFHHHRKRLFNKNPSLQK